MQNKKQGLTLKEVSKETGAPYYTIQYLSKCNRLPKLKESSGPGYPNLFHPDAVKIVKDHLAKGR